MTIFQSVMSRLDPGYSSWKGSILKHHNYAELQLLKLQLEVNMNIVLSSCPGPDQPSLSHHSPIF